MSKLWIVLIVLMMIVPVVALDNPGACPSNWSHETCQSFLMIEWQQCLEGNLPGIQDDHVARDICYWDLRVLGWTDELYGSIDPTPQPSANQPALPIYISQSDEIPSVIHYEVQTGDNWYSIARQFGVDVEAIWEVNGIQNPNAYIHRGNVFIIPSNSG